ncbi:SIR2 family protein [Sphingomonas aurantiaca]|uniref:SIR2 family protein n=1 Tax=Sphingomonas aurantiaca TaxID=185949 RepID=UPI002FE06BBD
MATDHFDDEPHVERIARAMWSREPSGTAAVLVGAGFSRNAVPARAAGGRMPGWNDIYVEMVDQLYGSGDAASRKVQAWLLAQTGATSAYLRVAEEYEAQFRRDGLDKLILRHVPDQQFEPGPLHRELLQLPWADVLTTNWDTLLERAADSVEDRVYDVVRTADEIPEAIAPRIVKLHGSFPSTRPFIFTEEDFRTYPTRFAPFVNLAQQLAMEKTLVLLGFSGDDPNFLYWSGWVRDRLGAKAPPIYLVGALDLNSSRRRMLEARGVQPIDLARLPQFSAWPDGMRVQNANLWFLERLRASEPYPARRWPRPQSGFVPPLTLAAPRSDPCAPPPELAFRGGDAVPRLLHLTDHCRRLRLAYPGWVVPPLDAAAYVWGEMRRMLEDARSGLSDLLPTQRLAALYEFDWLLQVSLVPLALTLGDEVTALLDDMEPGFDALDVPQADMFRSLVLSVVRHAREIGDDALFDRWADWLEPRVAHGPDERDDLTYQRCLHLRANLDLGRLEEMVGSWNVGGDPYWIVRRAGLLSDLGRDDDVKDLSLQALTEIRRRTTRGADDIASWSRESYAMLLRSTVLYGDLGSWDDHKAVRDRFDQRQELLAARGCTGRQDFHRLIESLDRAPPALYASIERRTRFDIGSSSFKLRFGGLPAAERRLLAYKAMRYLDETGLPALIGNVRVGAQLLENVARWLIDVEPNIAIDASMRGGAKPGSDAFEDVFSRATVASADPENADRLVGKLLRLAATAHERIGPSGLGAAFWLDRLRVAVELTSRFVLRIPRRAPDALRLALTLHATPGLIQPVGIPDEIAKLIARSLEAMDESDAVRELPVLFNVPVTPDPGGHGEQFDPTNVVTTLPKDLRRSSEWADAVALALRAAMVPETRSYAVRRLELMHEAGLLDEAERRTFGEALWTAGSLIDGLPGGTDYHPVAFLDRPAPEGVDPGPSVALAMLPHDLTDAGVSSKALTALLANDDFVLDGSELVEQTERLRRFVEDHPPAPKHPDIMGDRRRDLIEQTSLIFAKLARRAQGVETARPAIGGLADLGKHPLRIEPAIASLVALGLMDTDAALGHLRTLHASSEPADARLLEMSLYEMLDAPCADTTFEHAVWNDVATTLVARRPVPLVACLGSLIKVFSREPGRVPTSLDRQISLALDLILVETRPGQGPVPLVYEPFVVRFRSAMLAARLVRADRGAREVMEAWRSAVDADPLPDVRRAWRVGSATD